MDQNERASAQSGPTTYNLLFVCTGNTCRSPMAQAIAWNRVQQRGWSHVAVASAGITAAPGRPAADSARRVAAEGGLDLDEHRSRALTPELVDWSDLILAMTPSHAAAAVDIGGADKVALVTDFLEGEDAGSPVPDPFGGDDARYRLAFDALEHAVDGLLSRLETILAP